MTSRLVVASQSFNARYQGLVYAHLRKALDATESIEECLIERPREPEFLRRTILATLSSRPVAFIGISLRPDPVTVADLRDAGVPMVLIDEEVEGATTVACDNRAGGHLVGQHLAGLGRKSFAVVSGPASDYNAALRVSGFSAALRERHLPLPPEAVIEGGAYLRTDGEAAMDRLMRDGPRVDAVFCAAGDTCALGMVSVARELRVRIPEDLAIVGFDDIPLAAVCEPPLSTVRQSLDAIAREAHRLATQCQAEILDRPKRILVEPTLVLRRSA